MSFSAIICASQPATDSAGVLRANLNFAGQTLLEYQVRQAAEAGASRVMILIGAVTQPLSRAIDRLTADGIIVNIVRDMVSLLREAPREQDMLVVADGLVAPQRFYNAIAEREGGVLLAIDDSAATANFERIDSSQRWAGLARVAPAVLFGTLDMIGDWDLELTLMRAAVQAGADRILIGQDEVLEARLALIDRQAGADLVAQALLIRRAGPVDEAGAERYIFGPVASRIAPALLRSQAPVAQVRLAAVAVAAMGVVAALLDSPVMGLVLFGVAIILALTVDRLVRLARRGGMEGWIGLAPQWLVLVGIALLGRSEGGGVEGLYLAALLGILLIGLRRRRLASAPAWARFTPGTAVLLLFLTTAGGYFMFGLRASVICAILSLGAAVIAPNSKEN